MNHTHSWFTCCVNPAAPAKPIVKDFGFAVAPSYNGTITAKLHADTFSILKSTKNPDAAFKALTALAGVGRAADHVRRHAGRPGQAAGVLRLRQRAVPGRRRSTGPSRRPCSAIPDIPNHQAWVPNYAKAKAAWQAFQNKYRTTPGLDMTPSSRRCRRPSRASSTPRRSSFAPPPAPPGRPPRPGGANRGAGPPDRPGVEQPMTESTEAARPQRQPGRRRLARLDRPSVAKPSGATCSSAPGSSGSCSSLAGPMIASFVLSLTDFNLVHPENVRFVGIDNYIRMAADPTVDRTRSSRRSSSRSSPSRSRCSPASAFALLVNNPKLLGQRSAPGARLHAGPDPARRQHARVDRLPEHRDGLAERDPRPASGSRTGLDQQRDLDLPGAVAHRPVGHRQLHAHQHRRPAVRPDRAVRRGADRRRRGLGDLPQDHDPADVAGAALQPGHRR